MKRTHPTVSETIDRFGGTAAFARRFGFLPSRVSNWRTANAFPNRADIFKDIQAACEAEGIPFPEGRFGQTAA